MKAASGAATPHHLHLPLPATVHAELLSLSRRFGRPATALVREALEEWLGRQRRLRVAEEVAAYASEAAGSEDDLDPALEKAGLEAVTGAKRARKGRR